MTDFYENENEDENRWKAMDTLRIIVKLTKTYLKNISQNRKVHQNICTNLLSPLKSNLFNLYRYTLLTYFRLI